MNSTKIPRWGQVVAGGVLLSVALTAGGTGLFLNVSHGLEAGPASGLIFGLAEIGKIVIPIVAGLIGWCMQTRATAIICVLASVFCAVSYYADNHGAALLSKQHAETVYADKAAVVADLRSQVASLDALVAAEAKKGGCGTNCRDLTKQASEARQKLQAALNVRSEAKPVEASGLAVMISMASGVKAEHVARGSGAVKAALFLVLLEALVWLSVPAMKLLSRSRVTIDPEPLTPVREPVQITASKPLRVVKPKKQEPLKLPHMMPIKIDGRTKMGRAMRGKAKVANAN